MSPASPEGFNPDEPVPRERTADLDEWDTPIPLGKASPDPFPTDAIDARFLRDWIEAESIATQTPPDLAGVVALGVLAAASLGRVIVKVRRGYQESTNIYAAIALESGNRKSAVVSDATKPIYGVEAELKAERLEEVAAHAATRRVLDRHLADAEAAAAKATGNDAAAATENVRKLAIELANFSRVESPRFVVDDVTPEALVGVLAEQGGVLSLLSAEGGIFETIAGRYSQGIPNLDAFLKGHSGDQLRVDRRGRPTEIIARPCVTMCLAVQPDVLRALTDKPGFRSKGLVARFLYSLPPSTVGHRTIAPTPVPEAVKTAYGGAISRLLREAEGMNEPVVLTLTADASREFVRFETANEPRLMPVVGDLAHMADWGSKLPGAVARLAGLLHVAEHIEDGWNRPIEASTVRSAIALGHYFTSHAMSVFDLMGADGAVEDARRVADWFVGHCLDCFTRRDAHRALQRAFPRAADLDLPLAMLEERGWVRREDDTREGIGRPPSPVYSVNPLTKVTEPPSKPISVTSVNTLDESSELPTLGVGTDDEGSAYADDYIDSFDNVEEAS